MNYSAFMAPPPHERLPTLRRVEDCPVDQRGSLKLVRNLPLTVLKRQALRQELPLDVRVSASMSSDSDGHVVYHCTMQNVTVSTRQPWVVSYRFSELHTFMTHVAEHWTCHSASCTGSCQAIRDYLSACFPRKRLLGSSSDRAVSERKRKLELVLLHLLRCVLLPGSAMQCPAARQQLSMHLFKFLGVNDAHDRRSLVQIYIDTHQEELRRASSSSSSASGALTSTPLSSTGSVDSYAATWTEESDDRCVICLENLAEDDAEPHENQAHDHDHDHEGEGEGEMSDATVMLPCHHAFHRECVLEWLLFEFHCPLCRAHIAPQAVTNYCCPRGRTQWWLTGLEASA